MAKFVKIACTFMSPDVALRKLAQLEQVLIRRMPISVHMLTLCRIGLNQRYPEGALIEFHRYVDGNDDEDEENWYNDLEKESFIVCIQTPNIHTTKGIILLPPEGTATSEMVKAFDDLIGWDVPQLFHSVPDPFSDQVRELCKSHNNLKKEDNVGLPCITLAVLDIEKAKQMDTSYSDPNIKLKSLEQEHVPEIIENWKWALDHSKREIEKCIKCMGAVGALTEEGELTSSTMLSPLGVLGVLYTPEKFRRRGLGQLVIRALSKQVATEMNIYPVGEVETYNMASKGLFEKVGFEYVNHTKYIFFNPSQTAAQAS